MAQRVILKRLGQVAYTDTWQAMKEFTNNRSRDNLDEIWLLEHSQVFTQGQAGKPEHILGQTDIPIVQSDRGGQVTYHGPGQLILYCLLDLKRLGINVRTCVSLLEQTVIDTLKALGINAELKDGAPGVYVQGKKIASLGLRVRKGCTYHGLSLNVDMDLAPFSSINPCGYQGLEMTQISEFSTATMAEVEQILLQQFFEKFNYSALLYKTFYSF